MDLLEMQTILVVCSCLLIQRLGVVDKSGAADAAAVRDSISCLGVNARDQSVVGVHRVAIDVIELSIDLVAACKLLLEEVWIGEKLVANVALFDLTLLHVLIRCKTVAGILKITDPPAYDVSDGAWLEDALVRDRRYSQ